MVMSDVLERTARRSRAARSTPCRFNASTHRATAFVGCDVRRTSFFTATLDGCKLTGSVTLRGASLAGVDLSGVDLRAAVMLAELHGALVDPAD
jgi:uncharacterized protein YjbI with pentapeptide repeats